MTDRRLKYRLRNVERGLCWCGQAPVPGGLTCERCRARARAWNRLHRPRKAKPPVTNEEWNAIG